MSNNNNIRKTNINGALYYLQDSISDYTTKNYVDTELKKKADKSDVPTKVSELTNDKGYIDKVKTINHQSIIGDGDIEIQGSGVTNYNDLEGLPTANNEDWRGDITKDDYINKYNIAPYDEIPTKMSQLDNDEDYIKKEDILDTGWVDLELHENYENYYKGKPPQYRKIGGIVFIRGAVKNISDVNISLYKDKHSMAKLPPEATPTYPYTTIQQGNDKSKFTLYMDTDGWLKWTRCLIGDTVINPVPAGSWFNMSCVYCLDDVLLGMITKIISDAGDYNLLSNLPKIEGVVIKGNRSLSDFGIMTKEEITKKIDTKANITDIPTKISQLYNDSGFINKIKTINHESLIGEGDIEIGGGIEQVQVDYDELDDTKVTHIKNRDKIAALIDLTQAKNELTTLIDEKQDEFEVGKNIRAEGNATVRKEADVLIFGATGGGEGGTGDYNELINIPSIEGISLKGNKTLTELGIVIPTKLSDLSNDSGFVNEEFVLSKLDSKADKSDVPSKTSELTNDSDFINKTYVDTELKKKQGKIEDLTQEVWENVKHHAENSVQKDSISFDDTYIELSDRTGGMSTQNEYNNNIYNRLENIYTKSETDELVNNYHDPTKADVDTVYNKEDVDTKLENKADKNNVYNKNEIDFKLGFKQNTLTAGSNISIVDDVISATGGGEVQQIPSDWNQTDSTKPDFIRNKPNIPDVKDYYNKTETDDKLDTKQDTLEPNGNIKGEGATTVTKKDGVLIISSTGGEFKQIQSDLEETDETSPSFVKGQSKYYTKSNVDTKLDSKADKKDVYTKTNIDETLTQYQKLLTAGENISIDENNVISATGGGELKQVQADYNETDNTKVSYIKGRDKLVNTDNFDILRQEVTGLESLKADKKDVYTKTDIDTFLENKADVDTVYTRDEIDDKIRTHHDPTKADTTSLNELKENTDYKIGVLEEEINEIKETFIQVQDYTNYEVWESKNLVQVLFKGTYNFKGSSGESGEWENIEMKPLQNPPRQTTVIPIGNPLVLNAQNKMYGAVSTGGHIAVGCVGARGESNIYGSLFYPKQ